MKSCRAERRLFNPPPDQGRRKKNYRHESCCNCGRREGGRRTHCVKFIALLLFPPPSSRPIEQTRRREHRQNGKGEKICQCLLSSGARQKKSFWSEVQSCNMQRLWRFWRVGESVFGREFRPKNSSSKCSRTVVAVAAVVIVRCGFFPLFLSSERSRMKKMSLNSAASP